MSYKVGRPRILNDPRVPKGHICSKCRNDNSVVSFKIDKGYVSHWCNRCFYKLQHWTKEERREDIANRINDYQKEIYE